MAKRTVRRVVAALSLAGAFVVPGTMANASRHNVLTLAMYGDAPYGTTPTDTAQFLATPAFIGSVNADPDVSRVVHVGDLHSGQQFCTEAYDWSVAGLWLKYQDPVVYTPGDNEWVDCHKPAEGGGTFNATTGQIDYVTDPVTGQPVDYAKGDPAANLDLVRSIFFPTPGEALGGGKLRLQAQAEQYDRAYPSDAKYVENVMWQEKDTLFVTLNIPGGSNNDTDPWYKTPTLSAAQQQEVAERSGADLRWLDRAFATAAHDKARSVVIIEQADMWDLDGKAPSHIAGYHQFVDSIAQHTAAFGKPVLLFNGDSHTYRSDNPLSPSAPCTWELAVPCPSVAANQPGAYDLPNFHRVVVHGSTFPLEWLKLTVDPAVNNPAGPNAFGPFSWQRMQQH
jgi:hypothetical protein